MAGFIEGQLIPSPDLIELPDMLYNTACESTLNAAEKYKKIVDNICFFGLGVAECTSAAIGSLASAYKNGLKGSLKGLGKACSGLNDFQAAKEEMGRFIEKIDDKEIRRPVSVRLGEVGPKVFSGLAKMTVGLTYVVGVGCNALEINGNSPDSMIEASKVVATSINTITAGLASACVTPASMIASAGMSVLSTGADLILEHPVGAANILGTSVLLYVAASEAIRSSDESSYTVTRIAHKAAAVTAALFSVASLTTSSSMLASAGMSVLNTGGDLILEHPVSAANILGASLLLYVAASEATRSFDESSYTVTRIAHKAAAVTAALLSVASLTSAVIG